MQFSPSVFVRARRGKLHGEHGVETSPSLNKVVAFFKCPDCGRFPLSDRKDYLECLSCKKKWEVKDGIYDFREPMK